jgi:hypothetical protein
MTWASLKTKQKSGRLRYFHLIIVTMTIILGLLRILIISPISLSRAFCLSSAESCKRNYHIKTQPRRRGASFLAKNSVFSKQSTTDDDGNNKYPIHVLRDYYRPQDSLFSGIAEIGMGCSIGVLYSEFFIIMTGCGPPDFSDTLERISYQGVIVFAGLTLFNRIVTQFSFSLGETINDQFGPLQKSTLLQVNVAEFLSAIAVVGAIVALEVQSNNGVSIDGLSGIDINMCRAIRGDIV